MIVSFHLYSTSQFRNYWVPYNATTLFVKQSLRIGHLQGGVRDMGCGAGRRSGPVRHVSLCPCREAMLPAAERRQRMDRSALYHDGNRRLQDEFESRPIADRLEAVNLHTVFSDRDRQFIEGAAFFFLATADADGQPNVSHKGGMPGFVRVVGPSELAYPDYDGNGMFVDLGNAVIKPEVS